MALATILSAVRDAGGTAVVTADHGNAERMLEDDGSPHTAHTTNLVPLIVTRPGVTLRPHGRLADVAPTVLALLGAEGSFGVKGSADSLLPDLLTPDRR